MASRAHTHTLPHQGTQDLLAVTPVGVVCIATRLILQGTHKGHGRIGSYHGCPRHAGAELGTHLEHDLCLGQAAATSRLLGGTAELLHIYGQAQLCRLLVVA